MTDNAEENPRTGHRRWFYTLNHFKAIAAYEFFVAPADQNYILSRWMFINTFYPEAFWQASQAIEKYVKSILVLNGRQATGKNHNISDLYQTFLEIDGEAPRLVFKKPDSLRAEIWTDESVERFIQRIERAGDPDARYGLVSWYRFQDDIFKLDQLSFALRRLTVGLKWIVGEDWPVDEKYSNLKGTSFGDALRDDCAFEPRGGIGSLDDEVCSLGMTKADILHSWNFEFFRSNEDIQKPAPRAVAPLIGPARNSFLSLCWEQLHKSGEIDQDFREGMKWIVNSIKLEKSIKSEINSLIK